MVFHDQNIDISKDCAVLEEALSKQGYPNHCVHIGPLIRGEEEYRNIDISVRKYILRRMKAFFTHVDIRYKCFYIEKKHIEDEVIAVGLLSKQISRFLRDHLQYYTNFDKVIIYYDNGQIQINKIVSSVFNALLENVEFRKVIPSDYRLFQLADFLCSIWLIRLKTKNKTISRSEKYFFEDNRTLKKQYFNLLDTKEMK